MHVFQLMHHDIMFQNIQYNQPANVVFLVLGVCDAFHFCRTTLIWSQLSRISRLTNFFLTLKPFFVDLSFSHLLSDLLIAHHFELFLFPLRVRNYEVQTNRWNVWLCMFSSMINNLKWDELNLISYPIKVMLSSKYYQSREIWIRFVLN